MSNDLVVQLGANQFQSDMNSAGDMADSAVTRQSARRDLRNLSIVEGI